MKKIPIKKIEASLHCVRSHCESKPGKLVNVTRVSQTLIYFLSFIFFANLELVDEDEPLIHLRKCRKKTKQKKKRQLAVAVKQNLKHKKERKSSSDGRL